MNADDPKPKAHLQAKKALLPEAELYGAGVEAKSRGDSSRLPKTIGERAYNGIQFWFVKGLILAATAFIGYYAKFGNETNTIRKVQLWCNKWLQKPMEKLGAWSGKNVEKAIGGAKEETRGKAGHWIGAKTQEVLTVAGTASAGATVLVHGGNMVAPVVMWFENHRKGIIAAVNRRWGKPGDEALGNEKFKDLPQQNVSDVIKGRIVAWLTVFVAFVTCYIVAGKVKGTPMYKLDWLEENLARRMSGFKKTFGFGPNLEEKIAHIPMHYDLTALARDHTDLAPLLKEHEKRFLAYKASRIIALDIFATSMSIILWNFTSRLSARARANGKSFSETFKERIGFGNKATESDVKASETENHPKPEPDDAKASLQTSYASAPVTPRSLATRIAAPAVNHAAAADKSKASASEAAMFC